jgi:hypothetical protein
MHTAGTQYVLRCLTPSWGRDQPPLTVKLLVPSADGKLQRLRHQPGRPGAEQAGLGVGVAAARRPPHEGL